MQSRDPARSAADFVAKVLAKRRGKLMPMHQGFDLSQFKKVSSDAKSTTMRHSNGHEVKIVHSGSVAGHARAG